MKFGMHVILSQAT